MPNQAATPNLASALAGYGLCDPQNQQQAEAVLSRLERLSNSAPTCTKLKAILRLVGQRICALTEADLAAQLSCA